MAPQSRWLELMEVVTVGLPFCGFKVLVGLTFVSSGYGLVGGVLIALGAIDLLINLVNAVALLAFGTRKLATCFFSVLTPSHRDLGNGIDTMFSFTLVAGMIGGGHIPSMPPTSLATWNVCVIVNVLGAGVGRLRQSLGSSETERRA